MELILKMIEFHPIPLQHDLFLSNFSTPLEQIDGEAAELLPQPSNDLNSTQHVIIAIALALWFLWPRIKVWHLPTAPSPARIFFFFGHLDEICRKGLDTCTSEWLEDLKTKVVVYYRGRTPVVLVASPDLAREVLKKSAFRTTNDLFYKPPLTLNTAQGDLSKKLRKTAMPLMREAGKKAEQFVSIHCEKLEHVLKTRNRKSESIDLVKLFRAFSLDVVTKILIAEDIDTVSGNHPYLLEDGEKITHFQVVANESVLLTFISSMFLLPVELLLKLSSIFSSLRTKPTTLISFIESKFRVKKTNPEMNGNELHDVIERICGDKAATATIFTSFVASLDNLSSAMAMFFYFLATNPEVEEKLLDELLSLEGDNNDAAFAAKNSEYLDWCVKETFRLFTVVPFYGRVLENDLWLDKERCIPKGTDCVIAADCIHQDKEQWSEPQLFRPERFDRSSNEHKDRHFFAYIPFGFGRECGGKAIVLAQMKVVISKILPKYRFRPDLSRTPPNFSDIKFKMGVSRCPADGIHLFFEERKQRGPTQS